VLTSTHDVGQIPGTTALAMVFESTDLEHAHRSAEPTSAG
jgi:hypothetical protein